MANDCLLTKLKGVATNDSLPKLDSFAIKSMAATNSAFKVVISASSNVKIKARGNGYLADTIAKLSTNPKTEVSGTSFTCYLPGTEFTYDVQNKFALTEFTFEKCNLSGVRGGDGVNQNCVNLADLAMSPLTVLSLLHTGYGDLSVLKDLPIGNLYLNKGSFDNPTIANIPMSEGVHFYLQSSNIGSTGNTDIAQFAASNASNLFVSNYITGDIDDLVLAWVNNTYGRSTARTSGRCRIRPTASLTTITLQGNVINDSTFGDADVNWDGTSFLAVIGTSKVYQRGATAAQISTWEGAGKTVIALT